MNAARKLRTIARTAGDTMGPGSSAVFAPESTQSQSKHRVLFVDDEERILTALKTIFRSKYHVLTAANGMEALDFISSFKIPVIVSDQRMPGMLGVELLRRAREISPDSVRILLTGYSDLASIVGSINDGEVYRFISKPWDNQELQNVLAEAVEIGAKMLDRNRTQLTAARVGGRRRSWCWTTSARSIRRLDRMAANRLELFYAKSIQEALTQLESKEVAVLVADIDMEAENYLVFFNLLKAKYPQILVIVLTGASDSELVIHLINEAQIYRFLNKPVNLNLMHQYLHSALAPLRRIQERRPSCWSGTSVPESKSATSGFGQMLVARLRSLKNSFALQTK